jgi:hypothetical protein
VVEKEKSEREDFSYPYFGPPAKHHPKIITKYEDSGLKAAVKVGPLLTLSFQIVIRT